MHPDAKLKKEKNKTKKTKHTRIIIKKTNRTGVIKLQVVSPLLFYFQNQNYEHCSNYEATFCAGLVVPLPPTILTW